MRKLKILWVYPTTLDVFLHNSYLPHILNKLSELGHDITLISARSRRIVEKQNPKIRKSIVPLRFVPLVSPILFSIILFFYLPLFVIISKPDFVIMIDDVSIISSIPTFLISKFSRSRFVLDVRSIPVETEGVRSFLRKFWFHFSVLAAKRFFDGVTILTSPMKNEVCKSFTIDPDKVGVWTSGVSVDFFNPMNFGSESIELRRKLGLNGKFIVFYHGVLTPTRGLAETANALKTLRNKYPDIVLFILGRGPFAPKLEDLVQRECLQENVILAGSVDHSEVPKFISMCDVGIVPLPDHPYWRCQSPIKLLEYLAMEKVVVLTDIPAHRVVVGGAKCGIFISSIDPAEIAGAIEYAYVNKKYLNGWGKIGRELMKEKYTWEKVAKDLENYLLSI